MHLKNLFATTHIGQRHHHLAVKTTGSHQRRVEHIRAVGGGNYDHTFIAFKAVHFHQQLVQGLFTLVVTTTHTGATVTTHRINLVDKDNAGRMFFRLLEHIAHTGRTHADKHFHKIGTGNSEERHLGFTGNGFCQQSLTGTR